MLYLNENEQKIIESFMNVENEYKNKRLILKWNNNSQVIAIYDSFIEDESDYELDDERYEEFWSFVFRKIDIMGTPPIDISEDGFFLVNYHNFPNEILVDGKRII